MSKSKEENKRVIYTSEKNWLKCALKAFTKNEKFEFIDDAKIGITENDLKAALNLLKAAKIKAKLSMKDIVSSLASIGITGVGVWLFIAAIADPEPTSKLWLMISGGIMIMLTGSLSLLRSFGNQYSVSISNSMGGFELNPM